MKDKKSTFSKKRISKSGKVKKFKISPIILIVALLELVILIGVVSYAWFAIAGNKELNSGEITVAPDSGLKIDFNDPENTDFINIWNYLSSDFAFEPATSVDGRNIFFPTTGTFNETSTNKMKFRSGTVNDVNTKYISIDFTLTNENENDVYVFLDNHSYFKTDDNSVTGRALRIAFYQNNNQSGKTSSELLKPGPDSNTLYFNDNLGWAEKSGMYPKAYIWKEGQGAFSEWPGTTMQKVSGDQYAIVFPKSKDGVTYDQVIFNDGTGAKDAASDKQTVDLELTNNNVYTPTTTTINNGITKYKAEKTPYSNLVADEGYAVIAPGISTGFQRPYAPVTDMYNSTGKPKTIVPAFASSIDDYFNTDTGNLFHLNAHETKYLSLIMWLEGTDTDCVEELYSAKHIDLFLQFSKTDDQQQKNKYVLHDCTKERWLPDTYPVNGVDFNPVMQLYDKTRKRGYLMKMVQNSVTDYKDAAITNDPRWEVSIPAENSGDDFEFRRVNPYDEDEVWNYWNAGVNQTDKVSNEYHFTIFADGSPVYYKNGGEVVTHNLRSCGGLWGDYHTGNKLLTVYDASSDHYFKDNGGVMTISYSMPYTHRVGSGTQTDYQEIEYKGSTAENCYVFSVPEQILAYNDSSRPQITLKRYYNFNPDYAINAQTLDGEGNIIGKNPNITLDNSWGPLTADGQYYSLDPNHTSDAMYTYWGSDFLIVQADNNAGAYNSSEKYIQAKFYQLDNEAGVNKFKACIKDDSYKGNAKYAYSCVVPNDQAYTAYRIQACDKNNHRNVNYQTAPTSAGQYNTKSDEPDAYHNWYRDGRSFFEYEGQLSNSAKITSTATSNNDIKNNILTDGNIISLKDIYTYIFCLIHKDQNDPQIHLWKSNGADDSINQRWMIDYNDDKLYYYCVNQTTYSHFQFERYGKYWPANSGKPVSEGANKVWKIDKDFNQNGNYLYTSDGTCKNGWNAAENTSYGIYNNGFWDYCDVNPVA